MDWSESDNTFEAKRVLICSVLTLKSYGKDMTSWLGRGALNIIHHSLKELRGKTGTLDRSTNIPRRSSRMSIWHYPRNPCLPRISFFHADTFWSSVPLLPKFLTLPPCFHFETLFLSYVWVPELKSKHSSLAPYVSYWSQECGQEVEGSRLVNCHGANIHFWRWLCTVIFR